MAIAKSYPPFKEDANYYWFLGFVATDGNIQDTSVRIELQERDQQVLIDTALWLSEYGYNPSITSSTKEGKSYTKLGVYSTQLAQHFMSIGIPKRKSLVLEMPDVPRLHLADFLRGVIDGDGCITVRRRSLEVTIYSGSRVFLEQLEAAVRDTFGTKPKTIGVKCKVGCNDTYRLTYVAAEAKYLADQCYRSASLCLHRKRDLALGFIDTWKLSSYFWTTDELARLITLYGSGHTVEEIAVLLGRSKKAIWKQLWNLKC